MTVLYPQKTPGNAVFPEIFTERNGNKEEKK